MRRSEKNLRVRYIKTRQRVAAVFRYSAQVAQAIGEKVEPELNQRERMALAWEKLEEKAGRVIPANEFMKFVEKSQPGAAKVPPPRRGPMPPPPQTKASAWGRKGKTEAVIPTAPVELPPGIPPGAQVINLEGEAPIRVDENGQKWLTLPNGTEVPVTEMGQMPQELAG